MNKPAKNIAAQCRALLEPTVISLGYQLWDVEFVKEGTEWFLRITIDTENGISINDCERVHRAIDPLLDEADPIEQSYRLEVSSPGIERDLKTDAHIDASLGETVEVRFYAPHNGTKMLVGTLTAREGDQITVECEGETLSFPRAEIARLKTVFDFGEIE